MASYGAHIDRPLMRDLCYVHQMELTQRMDPRQSARGRVQ